MSEAERKYIERGLRDDLRLVFITKPNRDGCWRCGKKSVCHWCPPLEEARRRLIEWSGATYDA